MLSCLATGWQAILKFLQTDAKPKPITTTLAKQKPINPESQFKITTVSGSLQRALGAANGRRGSTFNSAANQDLLRDQASPIYTTYMHRSVRSSTDQDYCRDRSAYEGMEEHNCSTSFNMGSTASFEPIWHCWPIPAKISCLLFPSDFTQSTLLYATSPCSSETFSTISSCRE
jgi:hypothetical protein